MVEVKHHTATAVRDMLSTVLDPEIPALSVVDMGIIRDVTVEEESVTVTITPTYSGCPAMHVIEENIRDVLLKNGISSVNIKTVFSPAWTTDWLSEHTKRKLKNYGIAPPMNGNESQLLQIELPKVHCPLCNSKNTQLKSEFGSTACKSYYLCNSCSEPFEYFKPL